MITGLVRLGILKGEVDELIANNAHARTLCMA